MTVTATRPSTTASETRPADATPVSNDRAEGPAVTAIATIDHATTAQARNDGDPRDPSEFRMNRIAARAHQIYLARGGEHGRDMEDWLQAEREIDNEASGDESA